MNKRNWFNFPKCEFKHTGRGPIAMVHEHNWPSPRHPNEQAQETVIRRIASHAWWTPAGLIKGVA